MPNILRLAGCVACCGNISRVGALNPKTKTRWLSDLIIVHRLEYLQKYGQKINNTAKLHKGLYSWIRKRKKLKLRRLEKIS